MKQLNEDLASGTFKQIYLLYGDEEYLKDQFKKKLVKALIDENDTINFSSMEGKNIDVPEVINLADTMPFFSEHRVILLQNSGFFKTKNEIITEYIPTMPESTYMIFVETEIDKRNKLFKYVASNGRVAELGKQKEDMLLRWLLGKMKQEKRAITRDTASYIIRIVGRDMTTLNNEVEKLVCYTQESKQITREDVDEICTKELTDHIFQMVDAMTEGRQKQALDLYYELLALRESPLGILRMITNQYRTLLKVNGLRSDGWSDHEIISELKLWPFVMEKYSRQLKRLTSQKIQGILKKCALTEHQIKTGLIDGQLGVELLIVELSEQ